MRQNKLSFSTAPIKLIITGVLVGLFTILFISAISAVMIANGLIGEGGYDACALAALFLSGAAGAWYASKKRGEKYLLTGLLIAAILIIIRVLFSLGNESTACPLNVIWADGCLVLGSVLGGLPKKSIRSRRRI